MNVWNVLGGVTCLSLVLGTGAVAEIVGGEPGTSKNPKDNVPQEIQRATPSGGDFGNGGSGPGDRSDALSGMKKMKKEKAVGVTEQGLEQNAEKTHEGGAAKAAKEMEAQGEAKRSHSGGAAKAAKELEAEGEAKRSHSGGAAKAAKELEAEGEAKRSHSGGAAKAAGDLKETGKKSQKAISAQSAHQDMKKKLPKKDLEQADPPVKK